MGSIERQEERWTARLLSGLPANSGTLLDYDVSDAEGRWVARLRVPRTDEGRSTVAKMVAALQMEQALEKGRSALDRLMGDTDPNDPEDPSLVACQAMSAALEAAKRLQP